MLPNVPSMVGCEIPSRPPNIWMYCSQSRENATHSRCKPENLGATADFAMSIEAGVPENASPIPPPVAGAPKTGATKAVDGPKGLGKHSGPPGEDSKNSGRYCIPKLALANILEGLAPTGVTVILANMTSGSSNASPRFTEPSEAKLEAGGNLGGQ